MLYVLSNFPENGLNAQKLTQNAVSRLKNESDKDVFVRDTELKGFGLKITPWARKYFLQRGESKVEKVKG